MALALTTELLLQAVGENVKNIEKNYIGKIIEVIRNSSNGNIEYIILISDRLPDNKVRFFAIPACPLLISITEVREIFLLKSFKDLFLANSVNTVDDCPSPSFHDDPVIFELFEYEELN